jgi:hypothetical protein
MEKHGKKLGNGALCVDIGSCRVRPDEQGLSHVNTAAGTTEAWFPPWSAFAARPPRWGAASRSQTVYFAVPCPGWEMKGSKADVEGLGTAAYLASYRGSTVGWCSYSSGGEWMLVWFMRRRYALIVVLRANGVGTWK